jgi:hypothetical protein
MRLDLMFRCRHTPRLARFAGSFRPVPDATGPLEPKIARAARYLMRVQHRARQIIQLPDHLLRWQRRAPQEAQQIQACIRPMCVAAAPLALACYVSVSSLGSLWKVGALADLGSLVISGAVPLLGSLSEPGSVRVYGSIFGNGSIVYSGPLLLLDTISRCGSLKVFGAILRRGSIRSDLRLVQRPGHTHGP